MSTEQFWMNHVQNWLELLSDYLHVFYYHFEGHCEYGRLCIVVILSNLFSSLSPLSKGSGGLSICRIPFSTNYWFNACRTCLGNSISSKRTVSCSHRLLRKKILQGSHRSGNSGEILKTFSSQRNQGKTGVFQPKSGKKISNQGTFFPNHFQTF